MRPAAVVLVSLVFLGQSSARQEQSLCGTYRDLAQDELHLHRQARTKRTAVARTVPAAPVASLDVGDIAIVEDAGDVIARRNDFNLDRKTVQFSTVDTGSTRYRFQTGDASYDTAAASAGSPIPQLGDDASAPADLPFAFPFFGNSYSRIFVNSDGNLTFKEGDAATSDRSLGRMAAGPPRIAGLFMDLDPSRTPDGVRVLGEPGRFVVSWVAVPLYQDFGFGRAQTFQIRLYPDGRIEFAYGAVNTDAAVVGISPGGLLGATSVVSLATDVSGEYSSTLAERFARTQEVDLAAAAQKFYRTHDDAYDYLAIYNNLAVGPCSGSVACEFTLRNNRTGYGDTLVDIGEEFGSASRLQAVLNLGPLSQYPKDPNGVVPGRSTTGDTPLTIIAHEAGHLFLAYASVRDPNDPAARPMLNGNLAHWAFTFNSEASVLEGNRIEDNGPAVSPRFITTATVQGYAPLDQYLMGFRPAEEVAPPFLVSGPSRSFASQLPRLGVAFDGQRRDIGAADIIAAEGRRTPDHTVSQRHFRFAFILVVRQGVPPSQAELDQIDQYRREFEPFYERAASGRATADTALRSSLRLSTFPAAGVLAGQSIAATISIQNPPAAPLAIALKAQSGAVSVDRWVTIPAGATRATFNLTGVRAGVDEIAAQPADSGYDTAFSRLQVLAAESDAAQLVVVSRDAAQVTLRLQDRNNLPYPDMLVTADLKVGQGSSLFTSATTDSDGRVSFTWNNGTSLSAAAPSFSGAFIDLLQSGGTAFGVAGPVNAASFVQGVSPGGIAKLFGSNLAGDVQVRLDGKPAKVLSASDRQVDFFVPLDQSPGTVRLTVESGGWSAGLDAPVMPVSPGIFVDAYTGYGAVVNAATSLSTRDQPAARGDYVEIYCTGLGPAGDAAVLPRVTIGGVPAEVAHSGPAPGDPGLYRVDARIPADAPSGEQPLSLTVDGVQSNVVRIGIR